MALTTSTAIAIAMTILSNGGHHSELTESNVKCMANTVYYESQGESTKGQLAVANVIMNRVESKHFPNTICKVTKQSTIKYNKRICQFTWYCTKGGNIKYTPAYAKAIVVSIAAIQRKNIDPSNGAVNFYAFKLVHPKWAKSSKLMVSAKIGGHVFLKRNHTVLVANNIKVKKHRLVKKLNKSNKAHTNHNKIIYSNKNRNNNKSIQNSKKTVSLDTRKELIIKGMKPVYICTIPAIKIKMTKIKIMNHQAPKELLSFLTRPTSVLKEDFTKLKKLIKNQNFKHYVFYNFIT